jgi:two-component sensor histidine kinase
MRELDDLKQEVTGLRTALREKEVLLREIHHRVKNNMQIVQSLVTLQSRNVQDPIVLAGLRDCQNRIRAMALIHEKLSGSSDTGRVDFTEYLQDLTKTLLKSYGRPEQKIRLTAECPPVSLTIDQAVPCGLIIFELVSNGYKYAFPDKTSVGSITVSLRKIGNDMELSVQDDGVGLPHGFDVQKTQTLGLRLVCNLVQQLKGDIQVETRHGGTQVKIVFPLQTKILEQEAVS